MASRAKQATKLANRIIMSAKRRSRRPTAFHRLAELLSVRVLVFGVVVVVVASVPAPALTHAEIYIYIYICDVERVHGLPSVLYSTFSVPIGSLFAVPISTSTETLDAFDLLLFLSLSSGSTLLSADVDVHDEDAGREQIDDERPETLEWSSPFSTSCNNRDVPCYLGYAFLV